MITLKLRNYSQQDKVDLYCALAESLVYLKVSGTVNPRVEIDLTNVTEYLYKEIQSTEME